MLRQRETRSESEGAIVTTPLTPADLDRLEALVAPENLILYTTPFPASGRQQAENELIVGVRKLLASAREAERLREENDRLRRYLDQDNHENLTATIVDYINGHALELGRVEVSKPEGTRDKIDEVIWAREGRSERERDALRARLAKLEDALWYVSGYLDSVEKRFGVEEGFWAREVVRCALSPPGEPPPKEAP